MTLKWNELKDLNDTEPTDAEKKGAVIAGLWLILWIVLMSLVGGMPG